MAHLALINNQSLTYLISEKKTFQNFPNFGFVGIQSGAESRIIVNVI
jgi:hypothetical protein